MQAGQEEGPAAWQSSPQGTQVRHQPHLLQSLFLAASEGCRCVWSSLVGEAGHHQQHEPSEKYTTPSDLFMAEQVDNKVPWGIWVVTHGRESPLLAEPGTEA